MEDGGLDGEKIFRNLPGNQKILTSKLKTRKKCFLTRHFAENIVKALEEAFNKDLYLSGGVCGRPGCGGLLCHCAPELARLPGEADHSLALATHLVTEVGAAETYTTLVNCVMIVNQVK